MIKLLLKYAPNAVLDAVNAMSLAELDRRGLIVWADRTIRNSQLRTKLEIDSFRVTSPSIY